MRTVVLTSDAKGTIPTVERNALLAQAAGIATLNLWTHGWATGSDASTQITDLMVAGLAPRLGDDDLFVALHWPSDIAGDGSLLNLLELGSYYVMEARARLIGQTAGLAILRDVAAANGAGINVVCVGHSFGAIVAASMLSEAARGALPSAAKIVGAEYVAIQGALPCNALESGQAFGAIQRLYPRVKLTRSDYDKALKCWFPLAEGLECKREPAMGYAGPSVGTVAAFKDRLSLLDLSPIHAMRPGWDGPSGHHSDIDLPVIFDFIAAP